MLDRNFQIHQIMNLTIPMQVALYDSEEEEVTRRDILCLAIIRYPDDEGEGNEYSDYIEPMIGERNGGIIPANWLDGFLGIEYGGKSENWDDEIRELRGEVPDCECPSCRVKKLVN